MDGPENTHEVEIDAPDDAQITLESVKRLVIEPGSVLVLSVDEKMPADILGRISETMGERFPGVPCVLLAAPTFDLGVADLTADYHDELQAAFERVARDRLAERVTAAVMKGLEGWHHGGETNLEAAIKEAFTRA